MFSIILSMRHGRINKKYYLSISEDEKVFEVLLVFVLDLHVSGRKIIFKLII